MATLAEVKAMLSGRSPGQKQSGDINWYKFPKGTEEVKFRLLPPWEGSEFPIATRKQHFGLPGMGDKKVATCPSSFGMECPVCEVLTKYEGRSDEISKWAARISGNANVLIKKDPTQSGINALQPQVAGLTTGMIGWFMDLFESEPEALQALTDPYSGKDIVAKREKFNGKFELRLAFSESRIADDDETVQSVLAGLPNLDKLNKQPSDDDINLLVKAATELDDMIENKILAQATDNGGVADHDQSDSEPTADDQGTESSGEEEQQGEEQQEQGEEQQQEEEQQEETPPPPPAKKPAPAKPPVKAPARPAPAPAKSAPKPAVKPAAAPAKPAAKPAAAPAKAPTKPAAAPAKPTTAKAAPPAKGKPGKPAGSPDCFADASKFNEDSNKCISCEYEFECGGAIKKK